MKGCWNRTLRLKDLARSAACVLTVAALLLTAGCGNKDGGKAKEDEESEQTKQTGKERVKEELNDALTGLDQATDVAFTNASFDVTVSLELANGNYHGVDLNDYLQDSSVGLKMDAKDGRLGLAGDLVVKGDRVISGTAIYDDGVVGFQVPELDSTYYTIDLKNLLSQSYEGQQYLEMMEQLEDMDGLDLPVDEISSVLERYIDVIADTVTEDNATTKEANFTFEKLGGGENSGEVWTFTPTAQDVQGLVTRLADELENDTQIPDLALDLAVQYSGMIGYTPTQEEKDELRSEIVQGLKDAAGELRQGAEEAGREVEKLGLTCTVYSTQNDDWKLELSASQSGKNYRACAEKSETGFAVWADDGSYVPFELVVQYQETGGAYTGGVTFSADDGYTDVSVKLAFENVTDQTSALGINYGSYTLTIPDLGDIHLDVTKAASGGTDHVFSVDIPELTQECLREDMPDFNGARLTIHTSDGNVSVPTPGGPTRSLDLANMDPDELEEIFGPWEQRLEDIGDDLAEKLGVDD